MSSKSSKVTIALSSVFFAFSSQAAALNEAGEAELQDMSDPLAVYTQAGMGFTDKGLNLKIGQTYDTGNETTMGMNIIEIKGFAGESLGWNNRETDNSIDSIRYRNFGVDLTDGRGSQVDMSWDFDNNQGTASYSLIQALPKMGPVNLYPLAGLGIAAGEELGQSSGGDLDAAQLRDRYNMHGTFYVAGLYGKVEVTDKIWLNYNPMYLGAMSGSSEFKSSGAYLLHEAAVNYQMNQRTNIRYFANWDENLNYAKGDHRIEVNYQF